MWDGLRAELCSFFDVFRRHGKQVYLVGGAVRDRLLGQESQDYDFATDATPQEIQKWFPRVIPTGLQHGTVTVLHRGQPFEVTTFRLDGRYEDHRRPSEVTFTSDLTLDLSRRDFTINAIAFDLDSGELIDPFGGQIDLQARILRTVGDPAQRFSEDALRILRLFRFASKLVFAIDGYAKEAALPLVSSLFTLSRERVRDEMVKAMAGADPALAFDPWQDWGILSGFFVASKPSRLTAEDWVRIRELKGWERWSLWLSLASHSDIKNWEADLKTLVFSNHEQREVLRPFLALPYLHEPALVAVKAMIQAWGDRSLAASCWSVLVRTKIVQKVAQFRDLDTKVLDPRTHSEPIFLRELAVGGNDLVKAGYSPSPQLGRLLTQIQKYVWEHPEENQRDRLMELSRTLL